MTILTIKLTENQERLIKENNINPVEEFKQYLLEKLEDMEDIKKADKAYQEHLKNPKTYDSKEFWELMGLND